MKGRMRGISRTGRGTLKACLALTLALSACPTIALAEPSSQDSVAAVERSEDAVQMIGSFDDFKAAAQKGGSYQLSTSIDYDDSSYLSLQVPTGTELSLDLNGFTINMGTKGALKVSGSLTVSDTVSDGSVSTGLITGSKKMEICSLSTSAARSI